MSVRFYNEKMNRHRCSFGFKGHAWAPGVPPTAGAPRIQATQGRVRLDVTAASDRGRSSSSPPKNHRQGNPRRKIVGARQLVRQEGGVTAPRAGRGRPGWPMAAHQLASAYKIFPPLPPGELDGDNRGGMAIIGVGGP